MNDRPGWRVKVYRLDDDGKWIDEGTGSVRLKYIQEINKSALQVSVDLFIYVNYQKMDTIIIFLLLTI